MRKAHVESQQTFTHRTVILSTWSTQKLPLACSFWNRDKTWISFRPQKAKIAQAISSCKSSTCQKFIGNSSRRKCRQSSEWRKIQGPSKASLTSKRLPFSIVSISMDDSKLSTSLTWACLIGLIDKILCWWVRVPSRKNLNILNPIKPLTWTSPRMAQVLSLLSSSSLKVLSHLSVDSYSKRSKWAVAR